MCDDGDDDDEGDRVMYDVVEVVYVLYSSRQLVTPVTAVDCCAVLHTEYSIQCCSA